MCALQKLNPLDVSSFAMQYQHVFYFTEPEVFKTYISMLVAIFVAECLGIARDEVAESQCCSRG